MSVSELAAWSVILGLALMSIGGLVLWAYGARRISAAILTTTGPEAQAAQIFHTKLVRWFFAYGILVIVAGGIFLLWGGSILF